MNSNVVRIRILLIFICLWAIALSVRLYEIQVVRGAEYKKLADAQYTKPVSTAFERGSIFFESRSGIHVSAAALKEGYTLIMNPVLLRDPLPAYEALSQYIQLDRDLFMTKAAKAREGDQYEDLAKKIDVKTGVSIGELGLPGISVVKENWRVYPGDSMAAHTIGLVGYNEKNELAGRYGLERYYENTLNAQSKGVRVNFFAELFGEIRGTARSPLWDGQTREGNVVASLDPTVQSELEKVLEQVQLAWNSDIIGGVIMDPKTGMIYGMAARPTFDPNNLKDVSDPRIFSNPLVESTYEMGSIMKPLTVAAGLDSGAIKPESTFDDKGYLELSGKRISNYDGRARGVVPMQEVLSQSLNTGAAWIALKMPREDFTRYLLSFGLGGVSGIDQPNDQAGNVKNLKTGRDIEHATISYGQGIAQSPISTVRALSILANGGLLIRPQIAKEIEYADGTSAPLAPKPGIRVIQKETAEEVTRMLVEVVDKAIAKAHPSIRMKNYSIAAKTGTAQIADNVNGGYYSDRYLHSFFGYFPAYNPRFIVFLFQVNPKGAQYASETLVNPFIELTRFLINYYEIPPDR